MDLCGMTEAALVEWLQAEGERAFRAKQILQWVYGLAVTDWSMMTNLGAALREKLAAHIQFPLLQQVKLTDSDDGETTKFLWRLHDGYMVESVLIRSEKRRTVCVSSQVGCPARCAFCASGKGGFVRQLRPAEIVEQVVRVNSYLKGAEERVSHVVYMGMGEPLENYEAVELSVKLLTDPALMGLSQRRVTVSTVGVVEGIDRLAESGLHVNLVLSLHAPNQHLRKKIIPYARKYAYEEILAAMDRYAAATKRDITFEYTLLAGINDSEECARELAQVLQEKQCTVNLIPYNPVADLNLTRPSAAQVKKFRAILDEAGIINTCRYTKGDDIAAACGQLALQTKLEEKPRLQLLSA